MIEGNDKEIEVHKSTNWNGQILTKNQYRSHLKKQEMHAKQMIHFLSLVSSATIIPYFNNILERWQVPFNCLNQNIWRNKNFLYFKLEFLNLVFYIFFYFNSSFKMLINFFQFRTYIVMRVELLYTTFRCCKAECHVLLKGPPFL